MAFGTLTGVVAQLGLWPSFPLSPQVQATRVISAWPRAEKRFIRAMRVWMNKTARVAWAVLARSESYRAGALA
jgi:hypothetical protein